MPSKLGFQLHDAVDTEDFKALQHLAQLAPQALLILDSIDLIEAAYEMVGPGPIYIFQRYGAQDAHAFIEQHGSISSAVDRYMDENETVFKALRWAFHYTFTADRISPQLAEFDRRIIERAAQDHGIRLCVGNFLTGTPDPKDWEIYEPALRTAEKHHAIIGLQEFYPVFPYVGYGPNANIPDTSVANPRHLKNEIQYPQNVTEPGLYVGRYRHLRDYARQRRINTRIVITHSGAHAVAPMWLARFGQNLGGWQTLRTIWKQLNNETPEATFMRDIQWLDQHVYRHDPEVIATCLFAWNSPDDLDSEMGRSPIIIERLENYLAKARQDQQPLYRVIPLTTPVPYKVRVNRLRIRQLPSVNTKFIGGLEYDYTLRATAYTFYEGFLWLKHELGWSAYTKLINGEPDFDNAFLDGPLIATPRQTAAVNNFVGTIEEVRNFLANHKDQLFYIAINTQVPPNGARQFSITAFPASESRRVIDELHPVEGDPLMTPGAKKQMRDAGQT